MEKTDVQNKFFVCYAKADEKLATDVVDEISKYLEINYSLWSYAGVDDVESYFESTVAPILDNVDFVLFLVNSTVEQDEMVKMVFKYCNNLNKSMVPLKVAPDRLRFKILAFRSKYYDYFEKDDKESLLEQMHSWLGLTKVYEWSPLKFCSNCGNKIRSNASFCMWCGKQYLASAEKFCPKCGNHLKPTSVFCNRCGSPVAG